MVNSGDLKIEYFLLTSITIFVVTSLLFFILLISSRVKKIREKNKKDKLIPIIDRILFSVLFDNKTINDIYKENDMHILLKKKFFLNLLLVNVLRLHKNYSGDYAIKLKELYVASGLVNVSFAKLKAKSWNLKCEGIRELSQMDIKESYDEIYKYTFSEFNTLKLEAFVGAVRLKGLKGLNTLTDHNEPLNDWIQLNILNAIKNSDYGSFPDSDRFLNSSNECIVIFGLRLISLYNQSNYYEQIKKIMLSASSERIKKQAVKTIERLSSFDNAEII